MDAEDALSLARAREVLRSAQWELTALDPDYKPKQQVDHTVTLDTSDALGAASDLVRSIRKRRERLVNAPQDIVSDSQAIDSIEPE